MGAFTLIEMLVTIFLVGIGIAAVFGGLGAMAKAEARARDADLVQSLAQLKWDEFISVSDPSVAEDKGDFADQGYADVTWELTLANATLTDVQELTLVARRGDVEQTLVGLRFVPPTASTGTATAGGAQP